MHNPRDSSRRPICRGPIRITSTTANTTSPSKGDAGLLISSHRWYLETGPARGQDECGQLVSGNFFSLLGGNALLGRTISAEDDQAGQSSARVVLVMAFARHLGF